MPLRISSNEEKPLQASKWLQSQVLLSSKEMRTLFVCLEPFQLYFAGSITELGEEQLSPDRFLEVYAAYIDNLCNGQEPHMANYRPYFSVAMTADPEALYTILLEDNKQLVRIAKPIIQLQSHNLHYSPVDGKFRSMVFGSESISWGIQFSYPQIYQENSNNEIIQTRQEQTNANTVLFQRLQKWIRQNTIPTPFCVESTRINVPARLGKECLGWINKHPQLVNKELSIYEN